MSATTPDRVAAMRAFNRFYTRRIGVLRDGLLGTSHPLPVARVLFELGQREVERSRRYKRPLVAIMMDIDHFKFINDYYGHTVGDQVLQAVAKRCSDNLRRIDILGRLGGDEFTFLLPETDMFTASHVAERVRLTVAERPVVTEETPISISVSLGVARATSATPDLEVLISRADAAMYVAKREGRNRVEYG
jgi:diguanylate cyclase (GGDEF)-like protein